MEFLAIPVIVPNIFWGTDLFYARLSYQCFALQAVGGAAAFFLWRYFRGRSTDDEASDRTAGGVANIRYIETLYPANATEKRLFEVEHAIVS